MIHLSYDLTIMENHPFCLLQLAMRLLYQLFKDYPIGLQVIERGFYRLKQLFSRLNDPPILIGPLS
jgi:hypothetical protein